MGKGEIARYKQFLLFLQCFLHFWRTFHHTHQILDCRLQTLSLWKSLKFVIWERVNLIFPNTLILDQSKILLSGRVNATKYSRSDIISDHKNNPIYQKPEYLIILTKPFPKLALVFMYLQHKS